MFIGKIEGFVGADAIQGKSKKKRKYVSFSVAHNYPDGRTIWVKVFTNELYLKNKIKKGALVVVVGNLDVKPSKHNPDTVVWTTITATNIAIIKNPEDTGYNGDHDGFPQDTDVPF